MTGRLKLGFLIFSSELKNDFKKTKMHIYQSVWYRNISENLQSPAIGYNNITMFLWVIEINDLNFLLYSEIFPQKYNNL